eukprot:TRINITY_DN1632_c0_g1_i9.p1 TRINITY_DN1632_c0_g1~~TRINITY_DN1632_c0_g1_i9.p1  ORF type:complete len:526 (-),score=14.96 TRINITY_DN1632_c0_g1_i9:400-1977(-)
MTYLTLPEGLSWPFVDSEYLFVKEYYDRLWNIIKAEYDALQQPTAKVSALTRILGLGNPGIGKTAFLNYILYEAIKMGIPVLAETRTLRFYFEGGKVEIEAVKLTGTRLLYKSLDRRVLILHDHQPDSEPPTPKPAFGVPPLIVAPVSPDPKYFHEFSKRCKTIWFPLSTESEIIAMNSITPKLGRVELERRLALYGPIPRSIFDSEQEARKKTLLAKIQEFDVGRRFESMINKGELPEEKDGLSWWVVHVNGRNDFSGVESVRWATESIRLRVWENIEQERSSELENYVACAFLAPSLYGPGPASEYQRWAAMKIAGGTKIDIQHIQKPKFKDSMTNPIPTEKDTEAAGLIPEISESVLMSVQLPRSSIVQVRNLDLNTVLEYRDRVCYSTDPQEELCDAVVVVGKTLVLLQMTKGKTHSIKATALNSWVEQVVQKNKPDPKSPVIQRILLVFVVPFRHNFRLLPTAWEHVDDVKEERVEPVKRGRKPKKQVKETKPWSKVEGVDIDVGMVELQPRTHDQQSKK